MSVAISCYEKGTKTNSNHEAVSFIGNAQLNLISLYVRNVARDIYLRI